MNKKLKILLFSFLALAALFLFGNFGLNYWLKHNLPNYLKKNTEYVVNYKKLDVDLGTGNIFATAISIDNKNPKNQNVIKIKGTIDTLKISRFGIYEALVNKRISSTNLLLSKPNLNIILAKPIDEKTGKKINPVVFENINIRNGNISIFRHTNQKFVSVNNLNLSVENLQMTEESVEKKLPIVFDKYDIQGNNFYFRPDNVYALKAENITTKNGQMSIINFRLIPLLSYEQFTHFYPKKRNLYDFKTSEMDFNGIVLNNNKVTLSQMKFVNPELTLFTTNVKPEEKAKSFQYEVNLEDVTMNNAKISILKPDKTKLFFAGKLDLNVSKLMMDENSAKGNIPFGYEKFSIDGEDINYITQNQNIRTEFLFINQKSGDFRNVSIKPTVSAPEKTLLDVSAKHILFNINNWKLENNKLKLNAQNFLIDRLNGRIFGSKATAPNKKPDYSKIQFPLTLKNLVVKNSNLTFDKGSQPLVFNDLNANIQNIEMNEETTKSGIPFKTGNYSLSTKNFGYKTSVYQFFAGLLKFSKNNLEISNFAMKPLVSRPQFLRMMKYSKDLYTISSSQISATGKWDFFSNQKFADISQFTLNQLNANIYESDKLPSDPAEKLLLSAMLRKVKFPLHIQNTKIINSFLSFEEDNEKGNGGKLFFSAINGDIKNINSGKFKEKPTNVQIMLQSQFMKTAPMKVDWSFDVANYTDHFSISGAVSHLPASGLNAFVEPYLNVRTSGNIKNLNFNFKGNKTGMNGTMNMKHENLKVSLFNEEGKKKKLLSAIANMVVRTDSGHFPENVVVDNIPKVSNKSFFNMFWKGLQEGLKKILIGKNIEKTENSVKKTVSDIKSTTKDVKNAVNDVAGSQHKEGLFKKLFKKKKAEN